MMICLLLFAYIFTLTLEELLSLKTGAQLVIPSRIGRKTLLCISIGRSMWPSKTPGRHPGS